MEYEYHKKGSCLQRVIKYSNGKEFCSELNKRDLPQGVVLNANDDYFKRWLQCAVRPRGLVTNGNIRVVDLFCGCGGLSLGVEEACRALEYKFVAVLGADMAEDALELIREISILNIHIIIQLRS